MRWPRWLLHRYYRSYYGRTTMVIRFLGFVVYEEEVDIDQASRYTGPADH